ncbi:MAG: hypothetical protein LBF78_13815, partial [Treponema sp.]|nr:hypothetical protein [Treponema sp.]
MFGFLIKKNFFDLWDNLFRIALLNLGFIASMSFPVFVPPLLADIPVLGLFTLLIGILWCFVYLAAAAFALKTVSDYSSFGFGDFFAALKLVWPLGILAGFLVFLVYLLITLVIPF